MDADAAHGAPTAISALLSHAAELLGGLSDAERAAALDTPAFDALLRAVAPPRAAAGNDFSSPYEYLHEYRMSLALIARLYRAIVNNYSVEGTVNGHTVYVSPFQDQWFPDATMFLQGERRFEGLFGKYSNGAVSFAIAARDTKKGESMGPSDFLFVSPDALLDRERTVALTAVTTLDSALSELRGLVGQRERREAAFQEYLVRYPWVFGAQYRTIGSHTALDDRNIPDFTGVRVRDGARDIFEIKPPSMRVFRADGEFSAEFNSAWNQVERYLDFVRREADYLHRQKGLRFDAPRCVLLAGADLTAIEIDQLRSKERMNPAISVYTYDDLLALGEHTVSSIKRLRAGDASPEV